jgi:hypothetical protein
LQIEATKEDEVKTPQLKQLTVIGYLLRGGRPTQGTGMASRQPSWQSEQQLEHLTVDFIFNLQKTAEVLNNQHFHHSRTKKSKELTFHRILDKLDA